MEVKEYLKHSGLSAKSLSKILDVAHQTVCSWAAGVRPHPLMIKKMKRLTKGIINYQEAKDTASSDKKGEN